MKAACCYAYDGLGSVLGEIDGDAGSSTRGDLTKSRVYDAYGSVRAEDANYSKSGHRFVGGLGHPSEGETGLVYMRARYYDPAVGRFISEAPAKSGPNWFAYCGNDPVNRVDLTGKKFALESELFIGGVILILGLWFIETAAASTIIGWALICLAIGITVAAAVEQWTDNNEKGNGIIEDVSKQGAASIVISNAEYQAACAYLMLGDV